MVNFISFRCSSGRLVPLGALLVVMHVQKKTTLLPELEENMVVLFFVVHLGGVLEGGAFWWGRCI